MWWYLRMKSRTQVETSQCSRLGNSAVKLVLAILDHFLQFFEHLKIVLTWRQDGL
jgi:hypothetical protein